MRIEWFEEARDVREASRDGARIAIGGDEQERRAPRGERIGERKGWIGAELHVEQGEIRQRSREHGASFGDGARDFDFGGARVGEHVAQIDGDHHLVFNDQDAPTVHDGYRGIHGASRPSPAILCDRRNISSAQRLSTSELCWDCCVVADPARVRIVTHQEAALIEPIQNDLLAALNGDDFERLRPHLHACAFERGHILHHAGDAVAYSYFPCADALASFMTAVDDGKQVEAAVIGREGAVGGIISHGRVLAYATAQVQFSGTFLRVEIGALENARRHSPDFDHWLERYADCLVSQILQSVACNAAHTISQRTARWMVAAVARTGNLELELTQDQLAEMLGVGRSFVNRVLRKLKGHGVVATQRGRLIVRDLAKLKTLSCDCDRMITTHYTTIFGDLYPHLSEANDV